VAVDPADISRSYEVHPVFRFQSPDGPPLLFGLRLWASVSLALYVAFWLELDEPF
jgi:hypothetical protein